MPHHPPHRFQKFDIKTLKKEEMLNKFITVAPLHHNYALCIEYIKNWFFEKFSKDFFGYSFVDGSNVFAEYNKLTKDRIIKHTKNDEAEVIITPSIDESYDRENLDLNLFGIEQFINKTKIDKAFFQDPCHKKYILMKMDMILMNFSFKVRVPTRAMQLDTFKYMKLAFRIGLSETQDIDTDYLIPYPLMLSIASDCGFLIENDRIKEPIKFLTYLNSRSFLPILYKRSNVNDREEYFVRMSNLPVRIGLESISKDDGNKTGHLSNGFGIDMNINVRFPSMQLFVYYTKSEKRFVPQDNEVYNLDNTLIMALHQMKDPPPMNDKCWNLYIKTDYESDTLDERLVIDMEELFEGELKFMTINHLNRFVSPSLFIDIQLYNDGHRVPAHMDWDEMKLYCDGPRLTKLISTIALYVDLNYLNTQRMEKYDESTKSNRVSYSKPPNS